MGLSNAVDSIFGLIYLLLFISVLLTWVRTIDWYRQPFLFLRQFSEFFFAPFRRIIPPIGMIDISPIVAFIVLKLLSDFIISILRSFNL